MLKRNDIADEWTRQIIRRRLRAVGIDASRVLYDGITRGGYQLIRSKQNVERVYKNGRIQSDFRAWPRVPRDTMEGIFAAIRGLRRARKDTLLVL